METTPGHRPAYAPYMVPLLRLACVAAILAALPWHLRADGDFYLNSSDRVIFYGNDSGGRPLNAAFIETYVTTRFPQYEVEFVHWGWSALRLGPHTERRPTADGEIVALRPTVAVVAPAWPGAVDVASFAAYVTAYTDLVDKLRAALPALRITMVQPLPRRAAAAWEGPGPAPERYDQFHRELAREKGLLICNVEAIPAGAPRVPGEGVPGAVGLLKAWNAPALVTEVEIDSQAKRVVRSQNTTVRELESDRVVAWSEDDRALPLPTELTRDGGPEAAGINVQLLRVTGLDAGQYKLTIDGWSMGTFPRERFEEGIDLTALRTPMLKQAAEVHALTVKHMSQQFARWQMAQAGASEAQMQELLTREAETVAQRRAAAVPKTRDFEVTPVE